MKIIPTQMGFEQLYSDDSGVEFGVYMEIGIIKFSVLPDEMEFPIEKLDWLIECLNSIKSLQEHKQ